MSRNYTPAQLEAINRRGGTILVSAGAGSGKTTVLTDRIASLLTEGDTPADPEGLLVVTFTNAAASQMSSRVRERMAEIVKEQPQNAAAKNALRRLGRAQISTIDSFCATLVRENFNEADVPPDFAMADSARAEEMKAAAMSMTLEELYSDPTSGLKELSDLFGRSRSDDTTEDVINKTVRFESNLEDPDAWERSALDALQNPPPFAQSAIYGILSGDAVVSLKAAAAEISTACALCLEDPALEKAYYAPIKSDGDFISALTTLLNSGRWDEAAAAAAGFKHQKLGTTKKVDAQLRDEIKGHRDRAKRIIESVTKSLSFTSDDYLADCAVSAAPAKALFDAVRLYKKHLLEIKREKRLYEFNDIERIALGLLRDENGSPTPTAMAARERFDHILVDEYQDSNALQDSIFKMVSRDETNLFFVGDIKQSIYSFRSADPEIFAKRARACEHGDGGFPLRIDLRENFRSSHSVLDSCNAIFSQLMTESLGGTDYAAEGGLVAGPNAPKGDAAGTTLLLCGGKIEDEARVVARRIASMLAGGYEIEENGITRTCRPEDFCILLRTNKAAATFAEALEYEGLHGWSDNDENIFAQSEVQITVALLRAADNPRRDTDLAAAMLSPLFGFTADDMLSLRAKDARAGLYSLVSGAEGEKYDRLRAALRDIRADAAGLSAADTVRRCISALDIETLLCAGDDYSSRVENLRALESLADSLTGSTDDSLSAFLRMCERAKQNGGAIGERRAFSPPVGSVCIASVHKSKGLEWPIVFLADTAHGFNNQDTRDRAMLLDADLGVAFKVNRYRDDGITVYSHETVQFTASALAIKRRMVCEELRLRYVALTRAKYSLFISGCDKDPEQYIKKHAKLINNGKISQYDILSASNSLDWFALAFCASVGSALADAAAHKTEFFSYPFTVLVDPEQYGVLPLPEAGETAAPDPERVSELKKRLEFVAPTLPLAAVPAKRSVTAIAEQHGSAPLYRPSFAREGLTAAERGTAMHKFMQCADYKAAAQSAAAELARLVEGEYITPFDAEHINTDSMQRLFDSGLGRRLAGAETVMRELEFIDTMPAEKIAQIPPQLAAESVLVQGIADCVIIEPDGAVIVDYKSDRVDDISVLVERYGGQLAIYREVLSRRLPVPIKSCIIYSFALAQYVEL